MPNIGLVSHKRALSYTVCMPTVSRFSYICDITFGSSFVYCAYLVTPNICFSITCFVNKINKTHVV